MINDIAALKAELDHHNHLYYNLDTPELSDAEYDALKDRYIALTGSEYNFVPGVAQPQFEDYEHTYPILSLNKIKTEEDLRAELIRLAPGIIEPKLDGLTVVYYPDGSFVSRGNGYIGERLSNVDKKLPEIPKPHTQYPVRMEAFMTLSSYALENAKRVKNGEKPLKTSRNAVAGLLRNTDPMKVSGITYLVYNIVGDPHSETDQLAELRQLGFQIVPYFSYDETTIEDAVQYCLNFDRSALEYEIDGLVIKTNRPNALAYWGKTEHHPRSQVAWKFPSVGKWTTLQSVTNQVGRTGKITPVAEIAPVDIGGSTISRVTLHNYNFIKTMEIKLNSKVFVVKSNDVIPAITEIEDTPNSQEIILPSTCPDCNNVLQTINDLHYCVNTACPSKLLNKITHLASRDALDIEGLSNETAQKLIDTGKISYMFDIFLLSADDIQNLPGFAEKSALKLYTAIQKARNTDLNRFIYALGISNVGKTASRDIAQSLGTYQRVVEDIEAGCPLISQIDGIGPVAIEALKENFLQLIKLLRWVTPEDAKTKPQSASSEAKTFVITGTLKHPRSHYENLILAAGHKVSSSVSKKTFAVLCGTDAGSKETKAKQLGIQIISEDELEKSLHI